MINPKIFNAVLIAATKETKDLVLKELVHHISQNYDYNDARAGHIINMLLDANEVIKPSMIITEIIYKNPKWIMYDYDKYIIKNISVESVDNIDCNVRIRYDYMAKADQNNEDCHYNNSWTNISFLDHPEILK